MSPIPAPRTRKRIGIAATVFDCTQPKEKNREDKDSYHGEKGDILRVGLRVSS